MCKTGTSTNSIFDYNAMVNSIPRAWKDKLAQRTLTVMSVDNTDIRFRDLPVQAYTCTLYRMCLVEEKPSSVCAVQFWEHKFDVYLSNLNWQVAIDCTHEIRLRVLHWKILHNIYPTNILLHKMGIRPSRQCSYCVEEDFWNIVSFTVIILISCGWKLKNLYYLTQALTLN
jgi:hypothetical protein